MSTTAIVILNWNGKQYLEKYLRNLELKSGKIPGVSIVIADNGSTDGSLEYLRESHPNIRIIEFDRNYGFTGGYNRALGEIAADYFLLLNSDVEVSEGWLDPLINKMDSNPRVGICMPKIRSEIDTKNFEYAGACGGFLDILGYPFCRGRILSRIEADCMQYDKDAEIFWASGAALMIRSGVFRSLGGFDESFFAHMEEIDLCWRAKLAGWQVWVYPQSVVYHVGGGTLPNNSPKKLYLNYRNNLLMLYKNLPSSTLFPVVFTRMVLDGLSAAVYLVQGKRPYFSAVVEAHNDFRKMRKKISRDKESVNRKISGVFKGSIVLSFFLSGMKLKFSDIQSRIS